MTSHSKDTAIQNAKAQMAKQPPALLRVLLIDDNPKRATLVEQGLTESALVHTASKVHGRALLDLIAVIKPDVIIMDCYSPDRDSIESLRTVVQNNPKPIVMFVEEEDPQGFQQAIDAGVSAYVVDGLTPKRVKPVIDVAIARFKVMNDLRCELKKTKDDLAARKVIEKAKGMLMHKRDMTEDQAYAAMRTMSQERGTPLKDVAENIIAILSLLDD
ncbi:ANTAR domain-containing response regulator [Hirschia litorea]|uniref:ANTAR domain-containing response regulator n=1 Tax=Hirschia litorea TaxID=1199156 RepID=A0ABW2IHR1_9PROT